MSEENAAIRLAAPGDAEFLPDIEQSAGLSYLAIADIAWVAHAGNMPAATHRSHASNGTEWVAESNAGELVAFLCAERFDAELHIWELAVTQEWQRRGVGRLLVNTAFAYARTSECRAVTLTTFIDVAWNAPWYARMGFELLDDGAIGERLAAIVQRETERGLPRRCAMRWHADGKTQNRRD
ncbi:MAG TPA: GNAT family N-acetyltransferase [Povalibacter sp.]|nr:GNAT family N-acetyltransferase [Povalibacter sp.]